MPQPPMAPTRPFSPYDDPWSGMDAQTPVYNPGLTGNDLSRINRHSEMEPLRKEQEKARKAAEKRRQEELAKHLENYDSDPVSRAIGIADFELKQEEAARAAEQAEFDKVAKKHDDPVERTLALADHYMKKTDAPEAQQAFADREAVNRINERDKIARRMGEYGMGNAAIRESYGSLINVAPTLLGTGARMLGQKDVADEFHRQSGLYGEAREQARQDDMSPWLSRMYGGASQSMLQMAATPGGATGKMIGAGVMTGSEALTTAEDAGLEGAQRLRYAGTQGLLEAGIAMIGQKIFGGGVESRMAGEAVAAQTWKELAKHVGTDALKEMPEEVVTSILQGISSKMEGVSPDMTFGDFVSDSVDAAVQAAMMAPLANAGNAASLALRPVKPLQKRPDVLPSDGLDPVFPDQQQPDQQQPEMTPLAEMLKKRDEAMQEPSQPSRTLIDEFKENPSRRTYNAAIKEGMPPIKDSDGNPVLNPTKDLRDKYAKDLTEVLGLKKPEPQEAQNPPLAGSDQSQDEKNPPLAGQKPQSRPVEIAAQANPAPGLNDHPPDNDMKFAYDLFLKEAANEAQSETGTQGQIEAQGQASQQIQQQGLLTKNTGPWPEATPEQKPQQTKEEFQAEYVKAFTDWQKYPPDQAGDRHYSDILGAMYEAHPDWVDELEQKPPAVAGGQQPNQPSPPAVDSVSSIPNEPSKAEETANPETPKQKKAPSKKTTQNPSQERSLRSIVLSRGGISAKSLRSDYNQKELKQNGLLNVMRIKGLGVDELADMLVDSGDLRVPEGRTPADWLMDQLQNNADSAKAVYTDKEIESQLEEERKAYERLQQLTKEAGRTEASIEALREHSEEAGIHAASQQDEHADFTDEEANQIVDTSFDFGDNVKSVGDMVTDSDGRKGVITKVYPDGRLMIDFEETSADRKKVGSRYSRFGMMNKDDVTKTGQAPFPVTLNQFYDQFGDHDPEHVKAYVTALWDSLTEDEKSQFAHRLRKFGIPVAKKTTTSGKLAELVAETIGKSKEIPGKLREIYDITLEYPDFVESSEDPSKQGKFDEMMRRIDRVGLSFSSVQKATLGVQDMRLEMLHDIAKRQFGEDIANALFDDVMPVPQKSKPEEKPPQEEAFTLQRPPEPKKKPEQFDNNENSKQGALFDAGKQGELEGQQLLFNSDPGDLNNPKTMENKVRDNNQPKTETIEATNDDKTETAKKPRNKGVRGSSGKSGGTLAKEAGSTSGEGDVVSVPDTADGQLPEAADKPKERKPRRKRAEAEGDSSGENTGTESEPGRETAITESGDDAGAIQKPVEPTRNLRIGPDDVIAPAGPTTKLRANIAAIKLLKTLQTENREATNDEKRVLMQYTGWGAFPNVFDVNRGDAYIERPGLPSTYGEWYNKAQLYQKKNTYSSPQELRERAESWEKQWGEPYKELKELLTPDEWKRAKASTLNAHFTSREVITHGIWDALERFGVSGGQFLEPSSGIGSLIGLMPDSIASDSKVIAIELDSLTGEMVKRLYPDADVYVKGFEDVPIPPGSVDVAATNVPFDDVGPADSESRYGMRLNLHNYFIARMLDSLRPGGIAAVISTHYSMDANPEHRELLASKADLVGAIRLPNTAFKANAGTEVTTDIMFFRKPDGTPFKGEAWMNMAAVGKYESKDEKGKKKTALIKVNEYFANHPEMVLGTHSMEGTMYSDEEYTVMPHKGSDITSELKKAVQNLPAGIANSDNAPLLPSLEMASVDVEGRIELKNGKLQEFSKGSWGPPQWIRTHIELTKDGKPRKLKEETKIQKIGEAIQKASSYTRVRNAYENHVAAMFSPDTTDAQYIESQKSLNQWYDKFVKDFGALNDPSNSFLEEDPGFFRTSGLEIEKESFVDGNRLISYVKSDVFRERTIKPIESPTSAGSIEDALNMSLAWKNAIDVPWMSELTGKTEKDVYDNLIGASYVFKNPASGLLEPADTYLSGNVHEKLRAAEQSLKDGDTSMARNVESLKAIQPAKVTIASISAGLGDQWMPADVVTKWITDRLGLKSFRAKYNEKADVWNIYGDSGSVTQDINNDWGTKERTAVEMLQIVVNNQSTTAYKTIETGEHDERGRPKKKTVVDETESQLSAIVAEKMRRDFDRWFRDDETLVLKIEQAFNEQKNFYVKPQWSGEHLTFPGMDEKWQKMMRPYQKNTVARAIREGRGMIAHGVGAGKTLELIATAMEMKRLKLAEKPLIVVQNSTLGQFARTFMQVYPAAKVLVATPDDLKPGNRAKFMARMVSGNWDAVVMGKSTFNDKLPNDPMREMGIVDAAIAELMQIASELAISEGSGSPAVKSLEKQANGLRKRLDAIRKRLKERQDDDVFFEQMGVDALFLDEAHDFKKPPLVTKLDKKIKGISKEVSGRALSALTKMRFIQDKNNGRNTFMATGTPITNTLGEAWLLMNMVAPDVVKEFGVNTFDKFVGMFATVIQAQEMNYAGKWVPTTRLAKFKNGHQLGQFISSGWDVLLGDDLHDKIREYGGGNLPKLEGGKDTLHMVERSASFDRMHKFIVDTADAYQSLEGKEKLEYNWVPVTLYGVAKAAAIDVRLVDQSAPDDPGSKVNSLVRGVAESYRKGEDKKLTQLIFSDISGRTDMYKIRSFAAGEAVTLETAEEDDSDDEPTNEPEDVKIEKRWLYNEIKRKLIAEGIPESQVQIINDHNKTPEMLLEFQDKVNAGEVRIVIGHSDTLGTGVNVQQRLSEIWELDIPMVPAKREQRHGRIIRSGNMNEFVKINVMAMQKSLDGSLMDMNVRKSKFATQALMGKLGGEFDDPFTDSLMSMQDMMAAMNDDPLFFRQRDLEHEIRNLKLEQEAFSDKKSREQTRLRDNIGLIDYHEKREKELTREAEEFSNALKSQGDIKVDGERIKSADSAEKALQKAFKTASEKILKLTQNGKIKALTEKIKVQSDHIAADAEVGKFQFNLYYGARPVVTKDENDKPSTEWKSSTGTLVTLGGQTVLNLEGITHLSTILKKIDEQIAYVKSQIPISQKRQIELADENEKLREFLARPWDAQNELDNKLDELDQVKALMVQRDAPAAKKASEPEKSDLRKAADEAQAKVDAQKAENAKTDATIVRELRRPELGGALMPISDELARAVAKRMIGTIRLGVLQFDAFIKDLRANLDESVVRELKPILIRTWNGIKERHGLNEATEADFDSAMSGTVDIELEQAMQAAKAEESKPEPAEVPESSGRLYSTKNAFSQQSREELGMGDRPPVVPEERQPSIEQAAAISKTEYGRKRIDDLILELGSNPRAVTPQENDLLLARNVELSKALDSALRAKNQARKDGDSAKQALQDTKARVLSNAKIELVRILEDIGTASGRSLQARKAVIDEDFTVQRMALEYEAAFGKEPSPELLQEFQDKIDALNEEIKSLELLTEKQRNDYANLEDQLIDAHTKLVENTRKKRKEAKEAKNEERRKNAWEEIKKGFNMLKPGNSIKTYSGGQVVADIIQASYHIASGYSKLGIVNLSEFLDRVHKRMGPEMEQYRQHLTDAWKKVTSAMSGRMDIASITSDIDSEDPDSIGRAARNLHSFVIERDGLDASAEGREAAVNAVHKILSDYVPGISPQETARAMSGIGIYSPLTDDEIEAIRRDQKAQLLMLEQISDWKNGTPPPATGQERPPISDEQRALRRLVNEAKKESGILDDSPGRLQSALDAAKRMLQNRINDLNKAIKDNTPIQRTKKVLDQSNAEIQALREHRDELQKRYDEIFGKNQLSEEQLIKRAENALDRAIASLEADLKAGKLYNDAPKAKPTSYEIEAKRAQLDALKASRDEMRLQSGEAQQRSDAAYERVLKNREAELTRRLAEGDFMPAAKKPKRVLTPEMTSKQLNIKKMQHELLKLRKSWEFENSHPVPKFLATYVRGAVQIIRKVLTTYDESLIGRQGFLLGTINPKLYAKASRAAFASNPVQARSIFPTEQDVFDTQAALDADAHWVALEKTAKLAITDMLAPNTHEEGNNFVPEWVNKIWGIGGSERAGSAFLNTQRRLVFRYLVDKLATTLDGKRSITDAELRVIGNFVNVCSGRGTLGKFENAAEGMAMVFFSPRWWASRLMWLTGQPIWHQSRLARGEGASAEVRKMIAVEMAKQAAAQMAIMGITVAGLMAAFGKPGDDEEWDYYLRPNSVNFGKIRIGNTYVDMTAGLGQHVGMFARITSGSQVARWESKDVDRWDLFLRYLRGKLAPVPSSISDFMVKNQQSIGGDKAGSREWLISKFTPLIAQDVQGAIKEEGLPLGSLLSLWMFFGGSSQSYDARTRERGEVNNEVRALNNQAKGKSTEKRSEIKAKILGLLNDHLKKAAVADAKESLRTAEPEEKAALQKVVSGTDSPEMTAAIEKERQDIVIRAAEMLSTEDRTKEKKSDSDKGIQTARSLLFELAPTYEDAVKLYNEAYKERYGRVTEIVGGQFRTKKSVQAARRRLKAIYSAPGKI